MRKGDKIKAPRTEEHKRRLALPMFGNKNQEKTKSEATKQKIREWMLKNNPFRGRHHTMESREAIRVARLNLLKLHPEKHPNFIMANKQEEYGKYISQGQLKLYDYIKSIFKDAKLNYPVSTDISARYIDVPSLKLAFEYDGGYWHQSGVKDRERDKQLEELGWKITHIKENKLSDFINGATLFRMVRTGKKA